MPQMPPNVAKVRQLMRPLPIEDKCAALIVAIVDDDSNALEISMKLLNAIGHLSKGQSAESRFKISARMRDYADALEQPAVAHTS